MFDYHQLFEKGCTRSIKGGLVFIFVHILIILPLYAFTPHPYHVSYTEIDYNATEKVITLSLEVFTDDLETAIKLEYKPEKFFLGSETVGEAEEILIQKYVLDKTTFLIDGIVLKNAEFLPSESNPDRTMIYFQYTDLPPLTSVTFYSEILTSVFTDQQNIVEFRSGTKKEKALLTTEKTNATWKP